MTIAYLSAEIGLYSELHTYSGGLGVLAGDHLKSAADEGIDIAAVTLLYREGYGRQHLDAEGNQTETYPDLDPNKHLEDTGLELEVPLDGHSLKSKIWRAVIRGIEGHEVPVYFLDTRHASNNAIHLNLSDRLYSGGDDMRVRQEYLLGVGGIRALKILGHWPIKGLHLNEGHCSFAGLEMMRQGWAKEECSRRTLFTTHTPVPAGHDKFDWELVDAVTGDLIGDDERRMATHEGLCSMSHLGIRMAGRVNAVSHLNSKVASEMFPEAEIAPITNGVHHTTWISPPMARLYDDELAGWRADGALLEVAHTLSDTGLERARAESRAVLRELAMTMTGVELDGNRLTIGFARRFATYKRASLVFRDIKRLNEIGGGKIQFVFSGKAHPRDEGGKRLIKEVFSAAKELEDIPVAFLEDYSMATGLAMTSGVDVWLNTPVRPMEASGTSGMKAVMNGVPNLSILDGWWPEACKHGENGWGIGKKEEDRDDERDARSLYGILEREVLPMWSSARSNWTKVMKNAISVGPRFTGQRMIRDYKSIYESLD